MLNVAPQTIRNIRDARETAAFRDMVNDANVTLDEAISRRAAARRKMKQVILFSIVAGSVVGIGVGIYIAKKGA